MFLQMQLHKLQLLGVFDQCISAGVVLGTVVGMVLVCLESMEIQPAFVTKGTVVVSDKSIGGGRSSEVRCYLVEIDYR